jgi:TP901 family phage tail tape measure protein
VASKYSIEATFKLIDRISKPLDKIGKSGSVVSNGLKKSYMAAEKSVDAFGKKLKKVISYAPLALAAAGGVALTKATQQFIEFDSSVTAASAKFKDVDVTSANFKNTLKDIGKVARDVAAATEYTAVDTSGALDKMAMAGLTSSQSMKLLMGTTNLATAAGMDLTSAVDIATDALGAFGLMSSNEDVLKGNLDRISDVMAKTTNMFNTDMNMMFEAVTKGAPTFTAAGQSLEDFSSLIGVLASSGIKGGEAGTQLRNIMLSLANPTERAEMALSDLNITTKDSSGNFLNIIDILGQFERGTKNMGTAEKAAALSTIFGVRAVSGMNILLAEGADKLRGYSAELENAAGSAENIANAMRGSLKNQIEVLKSALMELGFKFVEVFQQKGSDAIGKLTNFINSIDMSSFAEKVLACVDVVGKLIGVLWRFRGLIGAVLITMVAYKTAMVAWVVYSRAAAVATNIISGVQMAYKSVVLGSTAATSAVAMATGQAKVAAILFSGVLKAGTLVQGAFTAATTFLSKAFKFLKLDIVGAKIAMVAAAVAQKAMTAAQWLLNAAMNANPIGLVVIAIAALIGVIALCIIHWKKITTFVEKHSEKIRGLITIFTGPFGFIISMIGELITNWCLVTEVFKSEGILGGLKRIGGVLLSGLIAPVQGLLELLAKIPGVKKLLGPAVDAIEGFRNKLKGVDGTKITAEIEPPETKPPETEPPKIGAYSVPEIKTPDLGMLDYELPDISPPDFSNGASGKSKLHGIIDMSGGGIPSIPDFTQNASGTITANSIGANPAQISESYALDSLLNVVKHIDSEVEKITRAAVTPDIEKTLAPVTNNFSEIKTVSSVTNPASDIIPKIETPAAAAAPPVTRTAQAMPPSFPPLYLKSRADDGINDGYNNPRNLAPITRAERAAYGAGGRRETVVIEVSAAKGTEARIVKAPRDVDIRLVSSGGNA